MLWVRSKAVEAYLGETLVGCSGLDGVVARWATVPDLDAGVAQLRAWALSAELPIRARIWLGSSLARPLVLASNCGARNSREASELASLTAGEVTGLLGELKVWSAPWRDGRPTMAVAIRRELLTALQSPGPSLNARRFRVDSVRPWWNQICDPVLSRSRTQSRAIGWSLAEPDGLVHGRIEGGEVVEAAYEAPKARDPDWTLLRRRLTIGWAGADDVEHFDFDPAVPVEGKPSLFEIGHAASMTAEADK